MGTPRVAILSAVETDNENPLDHRGSGALQDGRRGQITGGMLEGPLAFDNAVDPEAARIKGITSPVAGTPRSSGASTSRLATCWRRT